VGTGTLCRPEAGEAMSQEDRKRLVEVMAREIGRPLANMTGGCFRPCHASQRGECADGDCYCIRVQEHCAEAAIDAIERAGFKIELPQADCRHHDH
jgi:hypothetical protein